MPYQLIAAKARSKELGALWTDVDISEMTIETLFSTYSNVWMTLSHSAITDPVYLQLNAVRDQVAARYHFLTVPEWLVVNDAGSLPTVLSLPSFNLRQVQYSDAWRAGYTIKPIDRFRHDDAEIPYGEKDDLLLTKDGVDFLTYHRYALVSVNGFIHRSGGSPTGLQVVDGGRTGRIANNNHVGIMSFVGIGKLEFIPITPTMIYKTTADGRLADNAYIELPQSSEGKVALLVIGGYLHVLDEVYTKIGPRSIRINMNKIAWPERYFDSRKAIDLSSLPLTTVENDPNHVIVSELFSDVVLRAYLSLPQSFVVLVNANDFYVRRLQVPNSKLPGRYEVPKDTPRLPLVGAWGRMQDYVILPDWGVNVLACSDNARERYQFRTTHWMSMTTIDDSLNTYSPFDWTQAHFLEMGRFAG